MKNEIGRRLHRVAIKSDKNNIICRFSKLCETAENCSRCNKFFLKCNIYGKLNSEFQGI